MNFRMILIGLLCLSACNSGRRAPSIQAQGTLRPRPESTAGAPPSEHRPNGPTDQKVVLAIAGNSVLASRLANEFLCGDDTATCPSRPPYPCMPDSWVRKKSPTDFTGADPDFSRFFVDRVLRPATGADDDPDNGPENALLAFYVGDGDPVSWSAFKAKDVLLKELSLGDLRTRYFWMLSCKVMAHGPLKLLTAPGTSGFDNTEPQSFVPRRGDENVFERWGALIQAESRAHSPLNPHLRLACGGSTRIGAGSSHPMAAVMHYKNFVQLPAADSFILGLAKSYHVPLCITRGGRDVQDIENSPIYDSDFSPKLNNATLDSPLHIVYSVRPPTTDKTIIKQILSQHFGFDEDSDQPQGEPPGNLPVLILGPTPLPRALSDLHWSSLPQVEFGFQGGAASLLMDTSVSATRFQPEWSAGQVQPADLCVKRHSRSGAVVVTWRPVRLDSHTLLGLQALSFGGLFDLLKAFGLERQQWTGGQSSTPSITPILPQVDLLTMQTNSTEPVHVFGREFNINDIHKKTKCVYLRLGSALSVTGTTVPVFGEGAQWLLAICPRQGPGPLWSEDTASSGDVCQRPVPPVFTLAWIGRQVQSIDQRPLAVIGSGVAIQKAKEELARLEEPAAYEEPSYRWGYKSAPVNCTQDKMYLVYEVNFEPRSDDRYKNLPPITIEVPAHSLPPKERIEDYWHCAPRRPEID